MNVRGILTGAIVAVLMGAAVFTGYGWWRCAEDAANVRAELRDARDDLRAAAEEGASAADGPVEREPESGTAYWDDRIDAAVDASKADPLDPALIANIGHAYYEWAVELYEAGQQSDATLRWLDAVEQYDRSLALGPGNAVVLGNKGFALYYSNDPRAKDALVDFVAAADASLEAQKQTALEMIAEME